MLYFPRWPENWASEGHILHTSKSNCNENMKQYWCETSETFCESDQRSEFWPTLGPKMAQKFGPLEPPTKVAPMSLYIKFQVNPMETFQENRWKPIYRPS